MAFKARFTVAAALLGLVAVLGGCGGDGDSPPTASKPAPEQGSAPQSATETVPDPPDGAIEDRPGGPGSGGKEHGHGTGEGGHHHTEPPGAFPPERPQPPGTKPAGASDRDGIQEAVAAYVKALNAHDGAIVCELFVPGALRSVDLPKRKGSCAVSVTASIGYAAPGGQPRWIKTTLADTRSVVIVSGGDGRYTGTVVHRFKGSREPSIEDDVIYLQRDGGRWLIAKPSSTFYRAIGTGDVPLSALTPPK